MKKLFLFIAVLSAISLTSCKKDRVCTCTETSTEPGYKTEVSKTTYLDVSSKNATAMCIGTSREREKSGVIYNYTEKCELE